MAFYKQGGCCFLAAFGIEEFGSISSFPYFCQGVMKTESPFTTNTG